MELAPDMIVALNMHDEIEKQNIKINVKQLQKLLGSHIIPTSATKKTGIQSLIDHVIRVYEKQILPIQGLQFRRLPSNYQTAYPRKQTACPNPTNGLASIEALYLTYLITNRDTSTLLDSYYWKESFLNINRIPQLT